MRAKKVSWRTLQIAPTISEAIATSEAWAYVRTELQSGQIVNMRDASVATGPSELSDRHAKHLCGYKKYWSPPVELAVLPYTTVIFDGNADGYRIVFADNCICDDLTYGGNVINKKQFLDAKDGSLIFQADTINRMNSAKSVPGTTLLLQPYFSYNYYHWHAEGLSQILFATQNLACFDQIAVPPLSSFRKSLPELFPKEKLLVVDSNSSYKFRTAALSSSTFYSQVIHPSARASLEYVRTILRSRLGVKPAASRNVYLSRKAKGVRPMLNELQLEETLAKIGFDIVDAGTLNWEQQISVFSNARLLVSPHGAGLTNMIYLPEGAKAMELRPLNTKMHGSPFGDRLYRNLANLLELDYGAFVFENAFDSDVWTVDIGWLAPHLAQAAREA